MHKSNFKLTKEAKCFAKKLIKEAKNKDKLIGGVICKSNVKLDNKLNVIESDLKIKERRF